MMSALSTGISLISCALLLCQTAAQPSPSSENTIRVARIQCDAVPEQLAENLKQLERLTRNAAVRGVRWIMFHQGSFCDYSGKLNTLAESIPDGLSAQTRMKLSDELNTLISFGLSEHDGSRFDTTEIFMNDGQMVHRDRKIWLHLSENDERFRTEWARYDPDTVPNCLRLTGYGHPVSSAPTVTSFAAANACGDSLLRLRSDPYNRRAVPDCPVFGGCAKQIGAPMLVTNRNGTSWLTPCSDGCTASGTDGRVIAGSNRDGQQEILIRDLKISTRR